MSGNGVLSLNIKEKAVLAAAYMPFIRHGGLFVPTNKMFPLGAEVFMLLTLPDDSEKIPVAGKIVWITPPRAQGTRARGVGIQFSDPEEIAKARIENSLASVLNTEKPTHTM